MMTLSRVDKAALKLSIKACREEDPQRKAQIDLKLQTEEWEVVGKFCASCCQSRSLQLAPWEICPADFVVADLHDQRKQRGARAAFDLLCRMQACNVSKYHPSPITACEEAERSAA
jgi:hypothetical protein